MPRTYVSRGIKGATLFALTLNKVDWPKSLTGYWFSQDDDISAICVAEEAYALPLDCDTGLPVDGDGGVHHHCLLVFKVPMLLADVKRIVDTLVEDKGYDLQVCRSRVSWLKYISKSDGCPYLFNISVAELSLYARANHYITTKYKRPMPVDASDAFMVSAGNFRNVCVDMAQQHVKRLRSDIQSKRETFDANMRCAYVRKVYADILLGKHLYIYGSPGVGKTELIDGIVKLRKTWRTCSNDKWMFGTLKEDDEFAVMEDFDLLGFTQLPVLLSVMDRKPVSISEKYKNDETKMFSCAVIFISNYMLCSSSPLHRRVSYIEIPHKLFDCTSCYF